MGEREVARGFRARAVSDHRATVRRSAPGTLSRAACHCWRLDGERQERDTMSMSTCLWTSWRRMTLRTCIAATFVAVTLPAQQPSPRFAGDATVCFGFRFGAWTPALDWRAAGHPRRDSTPAVAMAPAGREWAATVSSGTASDSVLLLFPEWWPAGVKIEVPPTETGDTVNARATALVARAG